MAMSIADHWKIAERGIFPTRIRNLRTIPWTEFVAGVTGSISGFAAVMVPSLMAGDIWLLRGAFSERFMLELKARTVAWERAREQSFHKMLEGTPDFHRAIDLETGRKYSINGCKHSAYFYRWNSDPLRIWPTIDARWRVVKLAMGLRAEEYERFTPKDGVVDRIQVVRYPPSIGYLEPHADAHEHQRLFLSCYMSRRGVDYQGGGFYAVDAEDKPRFLEDDIRIGDISIGCATIVHGVAPCDLGKVPDWKADDGRWFLSLYSNASDEVTKRFTARPVKLKLEGVSP